MEAARSRAAERSKVLSAKASRLAAGHIKGRAGGARVSKPAGGFEDRGAAIHGRPLGSAAVRSLAFRFHDRPPLSVGVRQVACLVGCERTHRLGTLNPKVQGSTPCASTKMRWSLPISAYSLLESSLVWGSCANPACSD